MWRRVLGVCGGVDHGGRLSLCQPRSVWASVCRRPGLLRSRSCVVLRVLAADVDGCSGRLFGDTEPGHVLEAVVANRLLSGNHSSVAFPAGALVIPIMYPTQVLHALVRRFEGFEIPQG